MLLAANDCQNSTARQTKWSAVRHKKGEDRTAFFGMPEYHFESKSEVVFICVAIKHVPYEMLGIPP